MTRKALGNFRWMPGTFAMLSLSLSAKSIYPVMCCEANFEDSEDEFQISKDNIGTKTGINSFKAVNDGLAELKNYSIDIDGFEKILYSRRHQDREDRQYNLYRIWFPRRKEETLKVDAKSFIGGVFQFHRSIIESGVWAKLTSRQKVFWMGLRSVAEPPPEAHEHAYKEMELDGFDSRTYSQALGNRSYDVWAGSRAKLLRDIGIKNVNIYREVVEPLEEIGMVEQLPTGRSSKAGSVYKVFFAPEPLRHQMEKKGLYQGINTM